MEKAQYKMQLFTLETTIDPICMSEHSVWLTDQSFDKTIMQLQRMGDSQSFVSNLSLCFVIKGW